MTLHWEAKDFSLRCLPSYLLLQFVLELMMARRGNFSFSKYIHVIRGTQGHYHTRLSIHLALHKIMFS